MSVLLLSGGLDSGVCLALNRPVHALFVDYGQPHRDQEQACAESLAARFHTSLHKARITIPWWATNPDDPTMLVPGRNLILVSLAAALGSPVVIGCNADDYANYPDCRPEFFDAMLDVIEVETPLIDKTKAQIGKMAIPLGVSGSQTWSCYYPQAGDPCGECDACKGRAKALG